MLFIESKIALSVGCCARAMIVLVRENEENPDSNTSEL